MRRSSGLLHACRAGRHQRRTGSRCVPQASLGTHVVNFPVVNVPVHGLPALVLGLLTGRRGQSATYELTPNELEAAIALLAPAEAARMMNHPNLLAWRKAGVGLARGSCRQAVRRLHRRLRQ